MDNNQNEKHWELLVLFLKELAKDKGISQQAIADKTGMNQANVARIFSLKYSPSLKNFISIAQAIGVNVFFESKDSPTELNELFERAMAELGRRPDRLPRN